MKIRLFAVLAVFAAFLAYSVPVLVEHGVSGFLDLALAGGWASQVTIDLVIALSMFLFWMFGDAKERGIAAWPYLIAVLTTGSIGALAYLIHRTAKELATGAEPAALNASKG